MPLALSLLLTATVALSGCSGGDHAGIPKTEARVTSNATAQTFSTNVRARGVRVRFQRIEPASDDGRELWVGTYVLLAPNHEKGLFCTYVDRNDAWANITFEGRCVRDGKVT